VAHEHDSESGRPAERGQLFDSRQKLVLDLIANAVAVKNLRHLFFNFLTAAS
jgi:hypothetical protein